MKQKITTILLLGISFLLFQPIISFSEETATKSINGFSYEVLFPENQKNEKAGYYDLLVQPGDKQTVQMKLVNTSNQPMKIDITVSSAKTNGNGVVTFGPSELKTDASLKQDLSKLMTGPKDVLLEPKSNQIIDFAIEVPSEGFEGYVAGGIQLKPVLKEDESSKKEKVIMNKFAFVIGVLLSESETIAIKPELKLNDVSLKLKDAEYTLFMNMSNTKSVFAEELTATVQIRKKGETKTILEMEKKNVRMAPNSMMELPVFLEDQKVTAGEYTADVKVTSKTGQSWKWARNFSFSKIEAEQISKQLSLESSAVTHNYWWILYVILLFLAVSGFSMFYLKKKNKLTKKRSKRT
ncbi:DUF916 and DUF3324 domain-containing protein [Enterococcus ureasiticus]|uniref:Uncharacterized protein n=1 Tax=Enterococcus ureasiticus TaxID=903984 RepID=A0A1E5GJB2_9ENTE|nr:DUF916 and DUF3324 domain-containing protein [Enterococcus ureasiticus]OEG12777.1 hypothetical protein BCR21_16485 [Enterococcus ureasiticus]